MENNLKVRVMQPYPKIENAVVCPRTVGVLKDLISAFGGELNLILQFVFESTVADEVDENIGKLFEEMGIVHMAHMGLLMHALTNFGAVPKFEDAQNKSFNANCLKYKTKFKEMLELNIGMLNQSVENYTQASQIVSNDSLKNLFARIIKDNEQQLKVLHQLKNDYKLLEK